MGKKQRDVSIAGGLTAGNAVIHPAMPPGLCSLWPTGPEEA